MAENVQGLSGTVAPAPNAGQVCDGEIITITKGRADEFMSAGQCEARKTSPDTPYIGIEIGIAEYGTITNVTFRDYGGEDGTNVLSPNTMHGKIVATYELLNVGDKINMIASKKDTQSGTMIVWGIVLP